MVIDFLRKRTPALVDFEAVAAALESAAARDLA